MAEVTVDEETGEVTVHKVWAAHDCGRALNPVSVEGQIIGSVWMGMGQALTEEMIWKDGMLMNPGLLEYRSPSSVESPEVEPIIVEAIKERFQCKLRGRSRHRIAINRNDAISQRSKTDVSVVSRQFRPNELKKPHAVQCLDLAYLDLSPATVGNRYGSRSCNFL